MGRRLTGSVLLAAAATAGAGAGGPYAVVLGIAQDAGAPQAGCARDCCAEGWTDASRRRHVACLAVVDPESSQRWMIDATPDFREQLGALDALAPPPEGRAPALDGILLTHAHIGHYTGLVHLGREVIGAEGVPVWAMPRMAGFLESNGPWDQLVELGNVALRPLAAGEPVRLNQRLAVTPVPVPHRDEYSETVGFVIRGPRRAVLWLPDIDKWDRWDRRVEEVIASVDVAWVDGTFYDDGELPGRDMAAIPHPFIVETMRRLAPLPAEQRGKVRFVHLNHTNPALEADGEARRTIEAAGFRVAKELEREEL